MSKLSLEDLQIQFTKMIYGDMNTVKRILKDHFKTWDLDHVLVYRNGILYKLQQRIELNLFKTKEYVLQNLGKNFWDKIIFEFISENPLNPMNMHEKLIYIADKLPSNTFLKELCVYEALRAHVKFSDMTKYLKPELNASLHLCEFSYDVPRWYKNWLDSEQAQMVLKSQEDTNQSNEAFENNNLETEKQKTILPPPPDFISIDTSKKIYLAVFRNRKKTTKSISINYVLYEMLKHSIETTNSMKATYELFSSSHEKLPWTYEELKSKLIDVQIMKPQRE